MVTDGRKTVTGVEWNSTGGSTPTLLLIHEVSSQTGSGLDPTDLFNVSWRLISNLLDSKSIVHC